MKEWPSHLVDNLSDYLKCAPEKFQVSSTGFESMTCAGPVQWVYQSSYEATQMWSSQSAGLMCFRERNDEGQKCGWEMNWRNDLHTCWTISAMVHIWENRWNCPANKFYRIGNLLTSWTIVSSCFLLSSFFFCFFAFFCCRLQTWKRSWGYKKTKIRPSRNTEYSCYSNFMVLMVHLCKFVFLL